MKCLAAILVALPLLAAPPFTIEQILGTPFPSELVAAPQGEAFAWIAQDRGVRNVWIARGPAFTPVAVTRFTADDGQEISDLAWQPNGGGLFFTRGTGPNGRGEFANPTSDPDGAEQSVWMVKLAATAEAAELASGHRPSVAPDGSAIAFLSNGQVWITPLAAGVASARLNTRGTAKDIAWSPASNQLAFTSYRGDHAFIGVYNLRDKSLHYVDASADTDQSPVWSPDGSAVAFIRVPASRDAAAWGAKPTGQPWSIRVADIATGKGREIWRAREGVGSVFWEMTAHSQLIWTAGGRIVFPWERDGWLHLYSLPARGNAEATLLTPGDFEIEDVTASPDGKSIVYSSNQDDIDRRHIWRVSPDGGKPVRLTTGSGIEWRPAVTPGGQIAAIRSEAKTPARPALLEDGKLRDLVPIPADFPSAALVEPQPVLFTSPDGARIHAQLFLPPDGTPARHPAVIFFHGGARRQMLLGFHWMFYYHQAYGFNEYLAAKGYVVLSVNYRAGVGYGQAFRETPHYGATGAVEYNDVLGAAAYLRARADVDATRIGLWGGSYGGYLTALGLARNSDLFAAGVDIHGIHDWNLEITNTIPQSEPDKRQQVFRTAFESSPLASVAKWRSPVLLIQGDDDRDVAFANSPRVIEALRKQGVPFQQIIFPDEIHDFLIEAHWLTLYHAADEFLAKYLKP